MARTEPPPGEGGGGLGDGHRQVPSFSPPVYAAPTQTSNPYRDSGDMIAQIADARTCPNPGCACHSRRGKSWLVHCPAHADRSPSLALSMDGSKPLVHCHGGCSQEDVIAALRERDLWPQRNGDEPEAVYVYRDESGRPLYEVRRLPGKRFLAYLPGADRPGIGDTRRVIYRLPDVLAARTETIIFVVEGEKDADRLTSLSLAATTAPFGAESKWLPSYSEALRGRHVCILPDNDEPGRKHAQQVAASLQGITAEVRILALAGLPCKGDVSDWLAAGGTADELVRLAEESSSHSAATILGETAERLKALCIIPSTDIPPPSGDVLDGFLGPFLPRPPAVVMLSGETSAGKTVLSYNIAHALAGGVEFAGMASERPQPVLYIDLESPEGVHRDLVDTIGRSPNLGFIRVLPQYLNTDEGRDALRDAIRQWQASVVIVDPLSVAWPVGDENDNAVADRQMWGLKEIAVSTSSVIVALWNMGEGQVKEKFRSRGATARMDRADVGLNYTELTETSRQLKIIKSRYGSLGISLCLRFAGDMNLEAVDTGEGVTPSLITQAQEAIKASLGESAGTLKRKDIQECLTQYSKDVLDKALHRLVLAGEITRPRRGEYEFPPFSHVAQYIDGEKAETETPVYGHLVAAALEMGATIVG